MTWSAQLENAGIRGCQVYHGSPLRLSSVSTFDIKRRYDTRSCHVTMDISATQPKERPAHICLPLLPSAVIDSRSRKVEACWTRAMLRLGPARLVLLSPAHIAAIMKYPRSCFAIAVQAVETGHRKRRHCAGLATSNIRSMILHSGHDSQFALQL